MSQKPTLIYDYFLKYIFKRPAIFIHSDHPVDISTLVSRTLFGSKILFVSDDRQLDEVGSVTYEQFNLKDKKSEYLTSDIIIFDRANKIRSRKDDAIEDIDLHADIKFIFLLDTKKEDFNWYDNFSLLIRCKLMPFQTFQTFIFQNFITAQFPCYDLLKHEMKPKEKKDFFLEGLLKTISLPLEEDLKTYKNKALFTPSKMEALKACPGSYYYEHLKKLYPYESYQGTVRHDVSEKILKKRLLRHGPVTMTVTGLGISFYIKECKKAIINFRKQSPADIRVERFLALPNYYIENVLKRMDKYSDYKGFYSLGAPILAGTPDFVIYNKTRLEVIDLKCGENTVKIEKAYLQLMTYALLAYYNDVEKCENIKSITIKIVQKTIVREKTIRIKKRDSIGIFMENLLTSLVNDVILKVWAAKEDPSKHLGKDCVQVLCPAYSIHKQVRREDYDKS